MDSQEMILLREKGKRSRPSFLGECNGLSDYMIREIRGRSEQIMTFNPEIAWKSYKTGGNMSNYVTKTDRGVGEITAGERKSNVWEEKQYGEKNLLQLFEVWNKFHNGIGRFGNFM